jgi:D-arabinose 1-dehydrogenase-like Zn-dependent alcohol dehydrogenase
MQPESVALTYTFWHGELPVPLPLVLGHEPVGVIDATGPGVRSPAVGDRVGVSWFQGG